MLVRATNPLDFEFGDSQQVTSGYAVTAGKFIDVELGYNAAPDVGVTPPVRVSRRFSHLDTGALYSDAAENLAGISVNVVGDAANQMQGVGGYFAVSNSGTSKGGTQGVSPDSCALYAVGKIKDSGIGTAAGLFAMGQKFLAAATITAQQVVSWNAGGVDSLYSSSTVSDCAFWVMPRGGNRSGGGILFSGGPEPSAFDVGIGFLNTSPVVSASIRDDGNAATSILINGTHSGYGIDLNGGTFTGGTIRLPNNKAVVGRNAAGTADVATWRVNTLNNVATSTLVQADGGLLIGDGQNISLGTTTGTKIGAATTQKLGFFNATPVVQPSAVGSATGYTAGSTTATFHSDDKYTGNVGTTAYTINGIVAALKTLGLIAS